MMKTVQRNTRDNNKERGQSLVEMALSLSLLILILAGVVDIGRAYYIYVALEDSAGEAATYLSINPKCRTEADGIECANPNNAEFRARNAGGAEIRWDDVNLNIERPSLYGVGEPIVVTAQYRFFLITPIIGQIAGSDGVTLTVESSQIIITERS